MNYERKDGGFRAAPVFQSWSAAFEFARWVADSPEHDLLQLSLIDNHDSV